MFLIEESRYINFGITLATVLFELAVRKVSAVANRLFIYIYIFYLYTVHLFIYICIPYSFANANFRMGIPRDIKQTLRLLNKTILCLIYIDVTIDTYTLQT